MHNLTRKRVRELLDYDPESGIFRWKKWMGGWACEGAIAGTSHPQGYILIRVDRKKHKAHRLAFLYMEGRVPKVVDHINGKAWDNRWINLRPATISENCRNAKIRSDSLSGIKGVNKDPKYNSWRARIYIDGVRTYLGSFDSPEKAESAIREAREKHHGEFANHG